MVGLVLMSCFYIPDQMREHMGETILIRLDVRVSDGIIGGGETSDMVFSS